MKKDQQIDGKLFWMPCVFTSRYQLWILSLWCPVNVRKKKICAGTVIGGCDLLKGYP